MSEDVRPVPFAPGYFVSSEGHVYSEKWGTRRKMKPWVSSRSGHLRVTLRVEGSTVKEYVHRLIALVFIGPPPTEEHEVRHLDGKPANNDKGNLAWSTHLENMGDVRRHGTHGSKTHPERVARGERHGSRTRPDGIVRGEHSGMAKISEEQVRALRREFNETRNISEAARRVGAPRGAAKCVLQGKTWRHVA